MTPVPGSVPEPRPQQLITGDRAIAVLDTPSSAALQNAGVKLATVSLATYNELVATLVPFVFDGLDSNGQLKPEVMPTYLSQASINAIDVLDPLTNIIETKFLPSYLTPGGLTSQIEATAMVEIDTDPDGTPVVVGNALASAPTDLLITGTMTAGTLTAGTTHGDILTGTQGTITSLESTTIIVDGAAEPGSPASGNVKLWVDTNNRLIWKDSAAVNRRVKNIQVVTSLPASNSSYLGDECIIAATGEHRIYKGASLGWRLASPLQVNDIAARNALSNVYDGMRVYVSAMGQDHVYRTADTSWHGTQGSFVAGGAPQAVYGVNDTNFRTANLTNIADPGVPYRVRGFLELEITRNGSFAPRCEVWTSIGDYGTGANAYTFDVWYDQSNVQFSRVSTSALLNGNPRTGASAVIITWRMMANNADAFMNGYQWYNSYWIEPV